jgi:uncharacterized repeat protein (TIGR01451 family)
VVKPLTTGVLSNTASVTANETDATPGNNTATATTTVTTADTAADLALAVTDAPDPALVNGQLTYKFTMTNAGPATVTGVKLSNLVRGITFVSATASQGSCTGTSTVVCNLGNIAQGISATVTIVVKPTVAGTLSSYAIVKANEADPNTGNNALVTKTVVTTTSSH